jgi:copper transport protein
VGDAEVPVSDRGRGAPGSAADTVGIVVRFSTLATVSVVIVALAGSTMTFLELGGPGAVLSTTYGKVLLAKLAFVAFIVVMAVYNHFELLPRVLEEEGEQAELVPAGDSTGSLAGEVDDGTISRAVDVLIESEEKREGGSASLDEPDLSLGHWKRLTSTVRLEAIAMVVVLAFTGALVNITPARTASGEAATGPFNSTKTVGKGKVEMIISPAKAGSNAIHITFLSADGRPAELAQAVTVEMTLPDKGVGPLSVRANKAGVGHFIVLSTPDMSIAGTWNVTLVSRLSEFEQERTSFQVPVGA